MHKSCYLRTKWFVNNYADYLKQNRQMSGEKNEVLTVLDVGGKNWNGNFDFFGGGDWLRTGLDVVEGEGVDIIPVDAYSWTEIEDDSFDLVISANSFQHIDYFWETIKEMSRVVVPGGLVYVIAPSNRYDGKYPYANWAFNKHGLVAMAEWSNLEVVDCSVAGIPTSNAPKDWDSPLDDAVLIARKGNNITPVLPNAHLSYERRMGASI